MRIGTWNLEGRWSLAHGQLVGRMNCDLLLLTEVPRSILLPGYHLHFPAGDMQPGRAWAAIASQTRLRPLSEPHGATALAEWNGTLVASSVLPWRTCQDGTPWMGVNQAVKTVHAVDLIVKAGPVIWGGDWNHELTGRIWTGTRVGRTAVESALDRLGLVAPTADAPHRLERATSIDHVAVPAFWDVRNVERLDATGLSDHDAYVVEVEQEIQASGWARNAGVCSRAGRVRFMSTDPS